jgi:hypothetical protein
VTSDGHPYVDDRSAFDPLRNVELPPPGYTAQSLVRAGRRRRMRNRIATGAASGFAAATAVLLLTQFGTSGQPDGVDVIAANTPPSPAPDTFGDPRLPVCFSDADVTKRMAVAAATPAPGQPAVGIFPNVANSSDAIAYCSQIWTDNPATNDAPVPQLFACAYQFPGKAAALGFRGSPPSAQEVAVFPSLPGKPSTCSELGLKPLSQ